MTTCDFCSAQVVRAPNKDAIRLGAVDYARPLQSIPGEVLNG
jgi:hypothetical protein